MRMRYGMSGCLRAMLLACIITSPVGGAFAEGDSATQEARNGQSLETLMLAIDLADYGRREQDASALILAARLHHSVTVSGADFGGTVSVHSRRDDQQPPPNPVAAYLNDAERFAGGNEYQLLQVDALRALEPKEVIASDYSSGPLMHGRWLVPGAQWQFEVLVADREPVMVAAIGDGDAVIQLDVQDERGAMTASAPAIDYRATVRWQPEYQSRFTVTVTNLGSVESYVAVYSD